MFLQANPHAQNESRRCLVQETLPVESSVIRDAEFFEKVNVTSGGELLIHLHACKTVVLLRVGELRRANSWLAKTKQPLRS